jgi:starch synthase (maltosyl-transferring)
MHSHGGWPRHALDIIPNGIDLDRLGHPSPLDRPSLGLDPDAVVALFAGRIERQKDLPTLLDAARVVARSRPTFRLLLAGEGPDRPALMALTAADPDLSRAVHWLGFRADLPRLMATADILVLPSLWEGMPNVVLEAMSIGLPVVATDVEGSRDLVLPGQTGWLVPPADPTALAIALLDAHDRPDLRNHYGRTARARVRTEFSLDKMVASYESRWASLLGIVPQSRP